MATVYLAQDLKHDRKVAIKVLRPELAAVIGAERFLSEIKTTANLQHPHILPLHDSGRTVGRSDGRTEEFLFYVMPYVEGESLRDRLNREKQLPINDAIRIASEVAGALDYAHRHGIIHRDIKPENILLHDGRALVADFGIALAVSTAGTRMTETGMSLGTPHYMSPEQAMGDRELTPRSDVYALGAMTYEMLLGEPPFTGPTAQSIVAKVMTEKPAAIIPRRDRVPVQVEDAVLRALEKLPADRFATAAEFAAALSSDTWTAGQTSRRPAAQPSASPWRPIALGAFAIAGAAVLGLTYAVARARPLRGPSEYDVGLPDSAGMVLARGNFAVAPGGGFAVYPAMRNGHTALWYRSLLDATTRRIEGTEDATQPTVSPDGGQIAFIRSRGAERTVEVMTIGGGRATTLARLSSLTSLEWLADGRILAVEGDGRKARWLDPGGGPATTINLRYCILPAPLPDQNALLCGGGGAKYGYRIDIRDTLSIKPMRTGAADSGLIFGSDFRVIDGRYLTYMSNGGDLLATSIDLATGRAGRPVRMATGLGLRDYTGAGSFALSESGTLVYALGTNHAVGYLVRAGARSLDTLPVGREAFLRFSVSPDGRRLAAVVEVLEGEELRVYDLETGKHLVWLRHPQIRQPIWSPRGDRLSFTVFSSGSTGDSVFVGSPTTTGAPELAFIADFFEGFTWLPDGRLIGGSWRSHLGMAAQLDRRPVSFDTLLREASFVRVSPDAKWISYNTVELDELWVEPFPRTGKRYQVYAGVTEDGQWLSPSELAFFVADPPRGFDLVRLDPRADPPLTGRRRWIDTPRILGTAGQSSALTPDGRLVYVQGDEEEPVRYLRVIPHWVARMKRAVDEANR